MNNERSYAQSPASQKARALVESLQQYFVESLERLSSVHGDSVKFKDVHWLRDAGKHGGGCRYGCRDSRYFQRASVNVSQVHYEDDESRRLQSATALSTIIHPANPLAPSIHMHISWTEFKGEKGYWRIMADLNPSNPDPEDQRLFDDSLEKAAAGLYLEGKNQGEAYFHIPSLKRHRGVAHFYLEQYQSDHADQDIELAQRVIRSSIDTYVAILDKKIDLEFDDKAKEQQLAYHSLYFLQVLTLDRGTTSGLLIHQQNDVGTLGSLPAQVDAELLRHWIPLQTGPQKELLQSLVDALPGSGRIRDVTEECKPDLAQSVRDHYKKYPEALDLQAKGTIIPPTVANHQAAKKAVNP